MKDTGKSKQNEYQKQNGHEQQQKEQGVPVQ
jgi:hypothetical protein